MVFYVGLGAGAGDLRISFGVKFARDDACTFSHTENEMILAMLGADRCALVASLIVMVMISSYENFVGRFERPKRPSSTWLGKLDSGSLKIKVAASIVAISSIHLLQVFLNVQQYDNTKIMWLVLLHLTFVVSAVLLGYLEKIMANLKP